MSLEPFSRLAAPTVVLNLPNIDTDQIIPARFLTTTSRDGLGAAAFYDWRFDAAGAPRNTDPFAGVDPKRACVLVAGENFGCGSSREHAPWALYDFGFRVVLATKIADIFKSNALKNGLLAVEIDEEAFAALRGAPGAGVVVDLEAQEIELPDGSRTGFAIDPFARRCLLDGVDSLGFLLQADDQISAFEEARA